MHVKWAFVIIAGAGIAAALFDPSDRASSSNTTVRFSFDLSDTKQGELEEWFAIMEACDNAPDRDEDFQDFRGGRWSYHFNAENQLLCQFSDDDPVNAFVVSSELPRTHRLLLATNNGSTQWTFGPIPASERN